jgi:hypothetical protein
MNREFKSSQLHKVEEAKHGDWTLTFTTTTDHTENVQGVNVNGYKEGASVSVYTSSPQNGVEVRFQGCKYDNALADAITAEIDLIYGDDTNEAD